MLIRLFDRAASPPRLPAEPNPFPPPRAKPDPGYDALSRFTRLAADLTAAAKQKPGRSRWREGRLFFFDRRRQTELEAVRPVASPAEPFPELAERVAAELPALFESTELRHVARAVDGLWSAAEALGPACPAARELTDLLAIPDDEVFVVLQPASRTGFRLSVSGVADAGQFHVLLADAVPELSAVPARFVTAYRDANPTSPAGVPMVAEAQFQLSLPDGRTLWPNAPLADVPRVDGERVVLLDPPTFRQTWEVSRRFPGMPADVQLLDALSPFRVAERLEKLLGRPVSPTPAAEPKSALAKAA